MLLTSNAKDAFQSLLDETRDVQYLYNVPAYVSLIRVATLNGIFPFQHAIAGLMTAEAALLNALMGQNQRRLVRPESDQLRQCQVLVTHSPFGKLSFYRREQETPAQGEILLGGLLLDQAFLDVVDDECTVPQLLEQRERRAIDAILASWEAQAELEWRVNQVLDWVERVESVYLYIDRCIFTRSDVGENTLTARPHGILRQLLTRPLAAWQPAERLLIVGLHALFLTGRSIRFEEFNGKQLTAVRLRTWLSQKLGAYCALLEEEVPPASSLLDQAALVGRYARRVDESDWMRFRRIHGVTFLKEEHLQPPAKGAHFSILPPHLQELTRHLCAGSEASEGLAAMTRAALHLYIETGSSAALHEIIERIVLSAVLQAHADYGMSSSLRTPAALRGTPEQRIAGVLALSKQDFYCCVLPHPRLVREVAEPQIYQILYASAQRMEFNRWHFLPGNFEREVIPFNRHYYFPPMMPDIAEWSDLRHGGHTRAGVRYSIRAPGAPLWRAPFLAYTHPYRGCYDVRLVRIEGPPFGKAELQVARRHAEFMDTFWKTMQAGVEEYKIVTPLVTAYTRDWYQQAQWKESMQRWTAGQ
ncbi:MAG TPA: hypothetical protein VGF67_01520 [Ktedonobacteraceae bacterium]